jgi:outer membrane receptor protein involved in Fe transport
VTGFAAATIGRQAAVDVPLRRIPPANGYLAARYRWPRGVWLEANLRAARTQDRLAPGDRSDHRIPPGGTPGWVVSGVAFGVPFGSRITLSGGVANLFDVAYRVHGSGVDGPGRHLWTGLRATF